MNDEVRQIQEELFNRIVLGIALIGLFLGIFVLITDTLTSPWLIRAVALLLVAGVSSIIRLFGRLVVASYVLVLQLFGLVVEISLSATTITTFSPYLFTPVAVIAGFLLSPMATFVIVIAFIIITLAIINFMGQLNLTALSLLLPPFGITLLMAFLTAQNRKGLVLLGQRLLEDRTLLKDRTREMINTSNQTQKLDQKITHLKTEASQLKRQVKQTQQLASQKYDQLYKLVQQSIQELDESVKKLEYAVEQLGILPGSEVYNNWIETTWEEFYHLKALMINLEEITQIEHSKVDLNYHDINIEGLLSEAVGTTRGLARDKNLEVRYQIAEDLPQLQADPIRLRQALQHILSNAVKYTDRGIIEAQAEINEKDEMLIFVSDTGIGMQREETHQVFNKFMRGGGTLAQERQGAGLGLAISKKLIELHGGRIWVTSVLGVGSTFYIALPLKEAANKANLNKTILSVPLFNETISSLSTPTGRDNISDDEGSTIFMPRLPIPSVTTLSTTPTSIAPIPPLEKQTSVTKEQPNTLYGNTSTISLPHTQTAQVEEDDDDGATLVLPPRSSQTAILGHPIRRFGTTYIRRFGFILVGLLMIITLVVITLALINGPVEQQVNVTITTEAEFATHQTEIIRLSPTLANSIAQRPTDTPQPQPDASSQPTATPPTPTIIVVQASATAHNTPTSPPTQTPTPRETAFSIPTQTPLPTMTPVPTITPITELINQALIIPVAISQSYASADSNLTFFTGQIEFTTDFSANLDDDSSIITNNNSRLSLTSEGHVLFAGEQAGNRDIFTINPDNQQPHRLTTATGDDWQPDWSPNGQQVAFSSNRNGNFDIYIMDADGSNLTQLTTSLGFDEWPVWSPDGRQIAFVSDRDGNVEIYTMQLNGGKQQRITNHPSDDWPVAWSPDGKRLVFASQRNGNWNLFVAPANGGEIVSLTNAPGDERDPLWLPDGQTIAFAYNDGDNWDIYTLPLPDGPISEVPLNDWTQITATATDERYPTSSQILP